MTYWVDENWRANGHRATVHRGGCGDRLLAAIDADQMCIFWG